jgi:lipoprotein-anchoring transpeptidase ErfK/SrfK
MLNNGERGPMNSSPIHRPGKIEAVRSSNRSSQRSSNRSASSDSGRSGLAPIVCALVLVIALVGASCSSGKPKAAPVPDSTTTTTQSPYVTTIANVKGRTIEVLENDPTGASSTTTADSTAPTSTLPPIPRSSLNSAGVKKTDAGFEFSNPTYFRNPLVFDVIEKQGDWVKVLIPVRPNHTVGWVTASEVALTTTDFRFELDLSKFHLTVFKGAEVFAETDVVIGRPNTPTPVGRFYILEKIKQSDPNGVYGTWIFATNGYSETLDTFNGGLPVIAFHGTNQPQLIGTQASNGCVRMPNEIADKLSEVIPAGTPIDIVDGTGATTSPH